MKPNKTKTKENEHKKKLNTVIKQKKVILN